MAIKMDGHTITALQLKASDGSEVTKQLTEEGTIPTPTGSLSITANGTYDVTTKASAVVNVPAPEINLQNKTATANGEVTADEGYDGLGVVTVAVSGDAPTYQEKTATANGVVLPDEGYDALSKVTVNVPAPVLPTLTNPASASDILSGKEAVDGNGAKLTGTCTYDADTSDANAVASDIAEGKTAYVNGSKITGTATGGGDTWYFDSDKGVPYTANMIHSGAVAPIFGNCPHMETIEFTDYSTKFSGVTGLFRESNALKSFKSPKATGLISGNPFYNCALELMQLGSVGHPITDGIHAQLLNGFNNKTPASITSQVKFYVNATTLAEIPAILGDAPWGASTLHPYEIHYYNATTGDEILV